MAVITTAEGQTGAEARGPEVGGLYLHCSQISSACVGVASLPPFSSLQQDLENISAEEFLRRVRDDLRQGDDENEDTLDKPLNVDQVEEKNSSKIISTKALSQVNLITAQDLISSTKREEFIEEVIEYLTKNGYTTDKDIIEETIKKQVVNVLRGNVKEDEALGLIIPARITKIKEGQEIEEDVYLAFTKSIKRETTENESFALEHIQIPSKIEIEVKVKRNVQENLEEEQIEKEQEENQQKKEKPLPPKRDQITVVYRLNPIIGVYELQVREEGFPKEIAPIAINFNEGSNEELDPVLIFSPQKIAKELMKQSIDPREIKIFWEEILEEKGEEIEEISQAEQQEQEWEQKQRSTEYRILGLEFNLETLELQITTLSVPPNSSKKVIKHEVLNLIGENTNVENEFTPLGIQGEFIKIEGAELEDRRGKEINNFIEFIQSIQSIFPEASIYLESSEIGKYQLVLETSIGNENQRLKIRAGELQIDIQSKKIHFRNEKAFGDIINIRKLDLEKLVSQSTSINPKVIGQLPQDGAVVLKIYKVEDNKEEENINPQFIIGNNRYDSEIVLFLDENGNWVLAQVARDLVELKETDIILFEESRFTEKPIGYIIQKLGEEQGRHPLLNEERKFEVITYTNSEGFSIVFTSETVPNGVTIEEWRKRIERGTTAALQMRRYRLNTDNNSLFYSDRIPRIIKEKLQKLTSDTKLQRIIEETPDPITALQNTLLWIISERTEIDIDELRQMDYVVLPLIIDGEKVNAQVDLKTVEIVMISDINREDERWIKFRSGGILHSYRFDLAENDKYRLIIGMGLLPGKLKDPEKHAINAAANITNFLAEVLEELFKDLFNSANIPIPKEKYSYIGGGQYIERGPLEIVTILERTTKVYEGDREQFKRIPFFKIEFLE